VLAGVLQHANSNASDAVRYFELIRELAAATVATGDNIQIAEAMTQAKELDETLLRALLLAMAQAMEVRGMPLDAVLVQLKQRSPESHAAISSLFEREIAMASDEQVLLPLRIEAVQLLRHCRQADATAALLQLMQHDLTALQAAAIEALAGHSDPRITNGVLAQFPMQMPSVRRASLDLLLTTNESSLALLHAVESEQIAVADIDAARAERLKQHPDEHVRVLAQRLLGAQSTNRAEVVQQYRAALALTPDRLNGQKVFAANCAACHRLGGEGTAIGPDIGDAALRTSEQLLGDMLQPNLAVDANYVSYTAVAQDGRVYQGVIRTESDAGITLVTSEGKTVTLARRDLESLNSSGTSLMPEGIERQISLQQMSDLIAYLKNWRDVPEVVGE
jgi:putative heme-binding domain-containing protein